MTEGYVRRRLFECPSKPNRHRQAHLHNHAVHHTLTLWSLGADPEQMWEHYVHNTSYMLKTLKKADHGTVDDLGRIFSFKKHLGNEYYYQDYVHHFEREIRDLGYQEVIQKYLVGGSEIANDIMPRMWMGTHLLRNPIKSRQ